MEPIKFYIAVIGFFLAALVFGVLFFIFGMGEASYLTSDGVGYGIHYIDKPRYDSHFQGLIFTLSFLGAGILLLFLILLPDQAGTGPQPQAAAPQPRRRPQAAPQPAAAPPQPQPQPQPAAAPPPPQPQPQPPPQSAAAPHPAAPQPQAAAPHPAEEAASPMMEIEAGAAQTAPPPPPEPTVSAEQEVLTDKIEEELLSEDLPDTRYDDTGEEDGVYGSGRVSDDSIWDFIHNYPDSAVKFLYRKTLENKGLSPNEEDIYRRWEMRGMTRGKVREFVMEIMGWKALPDDFPHNIWRGLRDQIFELRSKVS